MGINQAIYTSSAKGISKGGGMGIHSYNLKCSDLELSDFELSYCQYYFSGEIEDIPYLPVKYVYGKTQNGRFMAAEVTYLGKDYNKENGRMGNLLSHMYSFGKEDLTVYPMELYGSSDFLTSIPTEDVDGTNEVNYLPETNQIQKGTLICIEEIQDFLGDGRMEMFCHMLAAVLKRDAIHKIIIQDTHENIVKWIASIEFSLPPVSAREITFSTFERDPMMSEFDIRGAVPGMSSGDWEEYASTGQFYVFDGIQKKYPEFNITYDYFQFGVGMGLAYSYDAMLEFYRFLSGYSYEKADEDIYCGFQLFQISQGGMASLKNNEFLNAVSFEGKYGNKSSYLELLEQLKESLNSNQEIDKDIFKSLQSLVAEFYSKELTEKELEQILEITLFTDIYLKEKKTDLSLNDSMWEKIYQILGKRQSDHLVYVMRLLAEKKSYRRLGSFQAFLLKNIKKENLERFVTKFYTGYWIDVPEEENKFFDAVIQEAADVYELLEEKEEKYEKALTLFLSVQEMGKGTIAGNGCNHLIQIIEAETVITDKKLFQGNKKKKDGGIFEIKQTKCAFEAFNYAQRNQPDLSISKIRLYHLAMCIVKTYEEGFPMTQSKALKIYSEYPVSIRDVSLDELSVYFQLLADVIFTAETSRQEYLLLLNFWKLTRTQKKVLINVFAKMEFDYLKKEKSYVGVDAILGAILDQGDEEYKDALRDYICGLKESFKEKVTDSLRGKAERDVFLFWNKLSEEEETGGKKGFFRFGRR